MITLRSVAELRTGNARPRMVVVRVGSALSAHVPRRAVVALTALMLVTAALGVFALRIGDYPVSLREIIDVFTGRDQSFARVVVLEYRMPRILLALVIGAALGVAGAIFQALTRNPLGSPDVIGFNTGAYTGALVVVAAFGNDYYLMAAGAVIGGVVAASLVYLLAYRDGVLMFRIIVVGIAVGAAMSSINQWITVKLKLHQAITASIWSQGTLNGLGWPQLIPVLVCVLLTVAPLLLIGWRLAILEMGDDVAASLGVRPERLKIQFFTVGIVLVAVTTAAAGPVSFVALAAPALARRITGSAGTSMISAAVLGAALLLSSDVVAQRILAPTQLPVGAVTVLVGGGYLVYLLVSQARRRL